MNVIVAALRKNKAWAIKLELFETHGNQPMMARQFRAQGPTWQNKDLLDAQLELLRWKKGLPQEPTLIEEEEEEAIETISDRMFPEEIEQAIRIRSKAINQREKAGRQLTQLAEDMSQGDRAELIKIQKDQHAIVAEQTRIIQHWKQSGEILQADQMTEKEQLEKEWRLINSTLSRTRKAWLEADHPPVKAKKKEKYDEMVKRQEELRIILGKQKRKSRRKIWAEEKA